MPTRVSGDNVESGKTTRIVIPQPESHFTSVPWEIAGVDVFVRHADGIPQLPETIGKFTYTLTSNRGTKVYPGPAPDILLVDVYRTRWIANEPVTLEDITAFLGEFPTQQYPWMHIEVLHREGTTPMYSKAQGE